MTVGSLSARSGVSLMAIVFAAAAHAQSGAGMEVGAPTAYAMADVGAQSAETRTPEASSANDSGAQQADSMGEIVVTANKRNENVAKVGLSIAVLSAKTLAERRITTLESIASVVPGLTFSLSATQTPILTLRGVGFNESSLGVYPAVSVYIDQAPLPFPVLSARTAFDLERVEVLKGPQGTLFGQNSTGGAINLIAAKPTDHFELGGDMSYGRFNTIEGNFHISGPITSTLRGRLAVTGANSDDWQRSATGGGTNSHQSYVAGRLLLDWDATDALKLSLNINGSRDRSQPQAAQLVALRVQGWGPDRQAAHPELLDPVFTVGSPRIADWSGVRADPAKGATGTVPPYAFGPRSTWKPTNFTPSSNRRQWQAALRADYELGSGLTVTSLSSYVWFDQKQRTDDDGSDLVFNNRQINDGTIRSFNQELRIANDPKSDFRWVLGGNYEKSKTHEDLVIRYQDISNAAPDLFFINGSRVVNNQNIDNFAFFGNAEYNLTDQFILKGAVRYTDSSIKNATCGSTPPGGNVDKLFNFLGGLLSSVPFAPISESDCYTLNITNTPGDILKTSLKQTNVSWRVGIDYKITPDVMAYANVARGYKSGSYPSITAASYIAVKPVTQEAVTAYEIGIKSALFDRRLRLTAAAFYQDYKDKQVRGRLLDPVFGALETLVNIPKSRIMGLEFDATANVIEGLTLGVSGTYLKSKIQKSPAAPYDFNIIGIQDNFVGDSLPFTPKWSGSFNADYRFAGNGDFNPFMGISVNTASSQESTPGGSRVDFFQNRRPGDSEAGFPTFVAPGVTCLYCIKGHTTVDLRAGVESSNGQWRMMLWGKNIFNEYYWTNIVTATESAARQAAMPATYGVSISFNL